MCAGEPRAQHELIMEARVYPRVCGGTGPGHLHSHAQKGLSPCVRGNLLPRQSHLPLRRSIPVCAGEPFGIAPVESLAWVYPRVCGGTSNACQWQPQGYGLSPCVRGNLVAGRITPRSEGSIPVCAGEPRCRAYYATLRRVYPRVCGGTRR